MTLRVCSPHLGFTPEDSGGAVYERELLTRLLADVDLHLILARGKPTPWDGTPWDPPGVDTGFRRGRSVKPGVAIHRLPLRRGLRWWVAPWVVPRVIRHCVAVCGDPDVLRVHSVRGLGLAALRANRRLFTPDGLFTRRCPLVAHWHHLDPGWAWLEGPVLRRMDHVITVSEFSKSQLTGQLRVDPARITVVPNGIEERFCPGKPAAAIRAGRGWTPHPLVLWVGGLKPRKNPLALLDIWPLVLQGCPEARLLIVGDGPLWEAMRRRLEAQGLRDRVSLMGHVQSAQLPGLYQAADVFLFPSSLEGFGRSVAEAMASGLPVVASNRGAIPEVAVEGEGAALMDPDVPEHMARSIVWLLQHPEIRQRWGTVNAERVNRLYRWPGVVRQVQAVYEEEAWR